MDVAPEGEEEEEVVVVGVTSMAPMNRLSHDRSSNRHISVPPLPNLHHPQICRDPRLAKMIG